MKRLQRYFFLFLFLIPMLISAQDSPSPILFIYDGSGSMWGQLDGITKKEIAADVLSEIVQNLPDNQNIGLIAYGHRVKSDCRDVEFITDLNNSSKALIVEKVKSINPLGKTPLAFSATTAINSLKTSKQKATIILITDGIESCDGNLCNIVKAAKTEGVDFKMHIVGFGIKEEESDQLKCAAEAGGGTYLTASNASSLGEFLKEATSNTVDVKEGNFTVYAIKNGKAIDALVTAYKVGTDVEVDGVRTYKDTSFLSLPVGTYDLEARPLENSKVKPIKVKNVKSSEEVILHQTISFDGGIINVSTLNNGEGWDCSVKILDEEGKVVGGNRTYGRNREIELNPGSYSAQIIALKIKGTETVTTINDIIVQANKTTNISHDFTSGVLKVGARTGNELIDVVVKIIETKSGETVGGSRTYTSDSSNPRAFVLNPGEYKVVLQAIKKEYAGKNQAFIISVIKGEEVTKVCEF